MNQFKLSLLIISAVLYSCSSNSSSTAADENSSSSVLSQNSSSSVINNGNSSSSTIAPSSSNGLSQNASSSSNWQNALSSALANLSSGSIQIDTTGDSSVAALKKYARLLPYIGADLGQQSCSISITSGAKVSVNISGNSASLVFDPKAPGSSLVTANQLGKTLQTFRITSASDTNKIILTTLDGALKSATLSPSNSTCMIAL